MSHSCNYLVAACIDFRFGKTIEKFLHEVVAEPADRVGVAGAVKDLPFLLAQVEVSKRLHGIKRVYLLIHEDCGAYKGIEGRQKTDLEAALTEIKNKFGLEVEGYQLNLDGSYEKIA